MGAAYLLKEYHNMKDKGYSLTHSLVEHEYSKRFYRLETLAYNELYKG